MKKLFFPVFVDLSEKRILVVGAGKIASRRIRTLIDFAGTITVIAPEVSTDITALSEEYENLQIVKRCYEPQDLQNADIVIVATKNADLNNEIGRACKEKEIPVNTSHDKSMCDFYFPGLIKKDNIVIGVTSSGTDHAKAREITEDLRAYIDQKN